MSSAGASRASAGLAPDLANGREPADPVPHGCLQGPGIAGIAGQGLADEALEAALDQVGGHGGM